MIFISKIVSSSIKLCRAVDYVGAGTVEYLLSQQNSKLSFLEVNTRLQVEHPVSEQTSGLDIVVEQIKIALGEPLSIQATPKTQTHAIEFRINTERSCTWIYSLIWSNIQIYGAIWYWNSSRHRRYARK